MGRKPHVIAIPCAAQSHVASLVKLAYKLAEHEIKVTFVNADFVHAKIMAALPLEFQEQNQIRFVSIPDGSESDDDRNDSIKHNQSILRVMPGHLQNLIEKINQSGDDEQITCVIADITAGWALELAMSMGIKRAAFLPGGLGNSALALHIPKLIESGIIDVNGMPIRDEMIVLSKDIPAWSPRNVTWSCPGKPEFQKFLFQCYSAKVSEYVMISDWIITDSFYELEQPACNLIPNVLPVGPLTSTHMRHNPGSFWPEDQTSLSWLDEQPTGSVIYVAFGSLRLFSKQELDELALGLELVGQPFLWVVRPQIMNGMRAEFPDGFMERVADRGKIVEWSSQEKVLCHPSIACFLSHCGWNSIMEGLSKGIPFLCWPFFADQLHNRDYICETWKIGLSLSPDQHGIVTRHEIETKIRALISDDAIKANALNLKEMASKSVAAGGSSFKNFQAFVEQLRSSC